MGIVRLGGTEAPPYDTALDFPLHLDYHRLASKTSKVMEAFYLAALSRGTHRP